MGSWLYQMSAGHWPYARYRESVWENDMVRWPTGKVGHRDDLDEGDTVFQWYAKTKCKEPGLYGWGVIVRYREFLAGDEIWWRPVFPSDYLKLDPLYDDELAELVDQIRGGFNQGTMWPISDQQAEIFKSRIRDVVR